MHLHVHKLVSDWTETRVKQCIHRCDFIVSQPQSKSPFLVSTLEHIGLSGRLTTGDVSVWVLDGVIADDVQGS